MKYGYARVSTKDQNLEPQIDALEKYGCQKIYSEKAKGPKADRPKWQELLNQIESGDTLVIQGAVKLGHSWRRYKGRIKDSNATDLIFNLITIFFSIFNWS